MESLKIACYLAAVLFIATQADGSFNPTKEEIDDFESKIDLPIVKAFNTTWNILKGSNKHGEKKEKESGEEKEGSEKSSKEEGSKKNEHGSKSSEKKKNSSGKESKKGGSSSKSSKFETKGSLTSSKSAKSSSKEKSSKIASNSKSSKSDSKIKLSKSGSSSSSFNSKGKESKNGGKGSGTIITKGSSRKGSKTIGYGSGAKSSKSSLSGKGSATIGKGSATVVKGSSKVVKGSNSAGKGSVTQPKGSVSSGKGSSSSKISGKGSTSVGSLSIANTKDSKAQNVGNGLLLAKLSAKLMDKGSKSSGAGSSSSKYSSNSVSKGSSSKSESSSSNVKSSSSKSDSSSYVVKESFAKSGSSGKGSKGSSKSGKGSKSKVPLTRVGSGCSTCAKGSHANGKLPGLYMILAGSSKVSNLIANESGLLSTPTGKGSTINSSSDKVDNSPNVSKANVENQERTERNGTNSSTIAENEVANLEANGNTTAQNMTYFDNGNWANCINCTDGNLTVNGSSTLSLNDGRPENVTNDKAKSQVANLVVKDNLPEHNVSKAEVEGMDKANEDKKLNCTKSPAMKRHAKVTGRSNDNETLDANYLTNTSKTANPNDTTYNSLAPMVNNSSVNDDLTMANDTLFGNTTMTLDDIGLNATEKVSSLDSSNATTTTTPPGHLPIQSKIP